MRPVTGAPRSVIHDPPPATHVLLLADCNLPPLAEKERKRRAPWALSAPIARS
ncbi:Uncharacterised protein [Burkholderia pseudomallei]|nr:hypothetical protein BBK_5802 [Burkholderia pseudomallei NCTC 13179]AIO54017.1 hypothetical protein DM55_4535 [Burkholderia mallei]AIP17634.1 hypothetical protein DP60_4031 [Burkholderia pseudomallei]AIP53941.1 hypothetical protein DR55_3984 [Burkholderia pseudomallei HBPUB10134a]AIS26201.1 hypothetical protein BM44_4436 [Burkholderia mallei NCTC 10247]AIS89884.1 hypothetical protein BBU_4750 [Burkholderia pseudomallei NAU35A-3]AJX11526.1 hypothetical protein BBW_4545 [Burkholderia pseudom